MHASADDGFNKFCWLASQSINRTKSVLIFSPNISVPLKQSLADLQRIPLKDRIGKYFGGGGYW